MRVQHARAHRELRNGVSISQALQSYIAHGALYLLEILRIVVGLHHFAHEAPNGQVVHAHLVPVVFIDLSA